MTRDHTEDLRRTVKIIVEGFSIEVQDTDLYIDVVGDQMPVILGEYEDDIDD